MIHILYKWADILLPVTLFDLDYKRMNTFGIFAIG